MACDNGIVNTPPFALRHSAMPSPTAVVGKSAVELDRRVTLASSVSADKWLREK